VFLNFRTCMLLYVIMTLIDFVLASTIAWHCGRIFA
jgi:hypothetical protein